MLALKHVQHRSDRHQIDNQMEHVGVYERVGIRPIYCARPGIPSQSVSFSGCQRRK
jgi:hypothetical protein